MSYALFILAKAIHLYSMLCFLRIIIGWFPGLTYTAFGKILCGITDPFLNLFRKIPLRAGILDFSPLLAFLTLSFLSSVIENIAHTGRIFLGGITATLLVLLWQLCSSVLTFFIVLIIIRFIAMAVTKNRNYPSSIWYSIDNFLSKIVYRFTRFLSPGRMIPFQRALIFFLIELVLLNFAGTVLFNYLSLTLQRVIPF